MKKLITQVCTIAILSSSLSAFASKQDTVRDVMATYSMNKELGMHQAEALAQVGFALQENNISSQDLMNYATSGMGEKEAQAYRASMASLDSEGLTREVLSNMSQGSNYRTCELASVAGVAGGIAAVVFIAQAMEQSRKVNSQQNSRQDYALQIQDLESDKRIFIGEGVSPSSFLITSIDKDINYLKELSSQSEVDEKKYEDKKQKLAVLGGVSAAVALVGWLKSDCYAR